MSINRPSCAEFLPSVLFSTAAIAATGKLEKSKPVTTVKSSMNTVIPVTVPALSTDSSTPF